MPISFAPRPATVLIVDDDATLRTLFKLMLRTEPYRILEADSGRRALTVAAAERPDVILLDVMLPDISGFEVCRQLRRSPGGLSSKIIIISALSSVKPAQVAQAGADDFWPKPIGIQDLRGGIQRLLLEAAPAPGGPLTVPA